MKKDRGNRGTPSSSAARRLAGAERAMGESPVGGEPSAARRLAAAERAMGAFAAGAGQPGRQAEAVLDEHLLLIRHKLATKDDIRDVRAEIEKSRLDAKAEIEELRLAAEATIEGLRAKVGGLQAEVEGLRAEFDAALRRLVFWSAGMTFLGMSGLAASFLLFF